MSFAPKRHHLVLGAGSLAVGALALGLATVPAAQAAPRLAEHSTLAELRVTDGGIDGPALVEAPAGRSLARPAGLATNASAATVARAHLASLAPLWGTTSSTRDLRAISTTDVDGVGPVVRFAQLVDGVPVYGGQLVVSLDGTGGLQSVGGDTAPSTNLVFTVSSAGARATALAAAAAKLKLPSAVLRAGTPFKYAYDPALVGGTGTGVQPAWRVEVGVSRASAAKAEVLVSASTGRVLLVNGDAALTSQAICDGADGATTVGTSDPSYLDDSAYGWCGEKDTSTGYVRDTNHNGYLDLGDAKQALTVPFVRVDTSALSGNTYVDAGYDALTSTANFYQSVLGYDLAAHIAPTNAYVENTNHASTTRTLAGTVRYCDPVEAYYDTPFSYGDAVADAQDACPYDNAFWYADDLNYDPSGTAPYPGGQMFIGRGLEVAKDVIGHEMTHGVTAATNALLYSGQPGAINESMSDVFGQLVQEYAAPGTDTGWLVGDELDGPLLNGAVRSMSNPTATNLPEGDAYGQPERLDRPTCPTVPTVACWASDSASAADYGGVHTNSGVGNKAAYLIAHGGTVGGVTAARLDQVHPSDSREATTKVAWLYWTAQHLLPSNANYRRLGITLDLACRQLAASTTNKHGFTTADCTNSVDKAVSATRMTSSHVSATINRSSLAYGKAVSVTAHITDTRGRVAVGTSVRLQKLVRGAKAWVNVSTATTGSVGTKTWSVKPTSTTYYRVVQVASGALPTVVSSSHRVNVAPTISRAASAKKIKYKKTFTVRGKVSPKGAGRTVTLQRYSGGAWHTLKSAKVSSSSRYSIKYKPTSHADRYYRVRMAASTKFVSAVSSRFFVTVK